MPLCTLHLLSLQPPTTVVPFLETLIPTLSSPPIIISRPIRWIITPTHITTDELLRPLGPQSTIPSATDWDVLLVFAGEKNPIHPQLLSNHVRAHFSFVTGIPSSVLEDFPEKNAKLLRPNADIVPQLTGALEKPRIAKTSQDLEFTREIEGWAPQYAKQRSRGKGAISMLNFLAFNPGKEAHESYARYGKAFADRIGSKRGGDAKLVGKIVPSELEKQMKKEGGGGWEEFALAHYPSIMHFADMIGSEDYQEVNKTHRVGALRDTCILMTSELDPDVDDGVRRGLLNMHRGGGSKL